MSSERNVVWASCDEPGFEHLRLTNHDDRIVADGIILRVGTDESLRIRYRILCDITWRVREVTVSLLDADGHQLGLSVAEDGYWSDDAGNRLSSLDGCFGVDISATPFTNTLAIRQLGLKPGQSAAAVVAFILVPQMEVQPSRQRYTCLEINRQGAIYRYEDEGLFKGFVADLRVDPSGLVIEYPNLFKRVEP